MTKTLTEQWKKKELKDGDYYVLNKAGDIVCDYYIEILGHFDSVLTENVKEVLAPVPSYDEWHRVKDLGLRPDYTDHIEKWEDCAMLTKKLEIATKALEKFKEQERDYLDYGIDKDGNKIYLYPNRVATKALKEMEGVK